MDLEEKVLKKIDLSLLNNLSSPNVASKLLYRFERYSGNCPTEEDFYKVYQKYSECKEQYGEIFDSCGAIRPAIFSPLGICIRIRSPLFIILEKYLFSRKIINEKIFNQFGK